MLILFQLGLRPQQELLRVMMVLYEMTRVLLPVAVWREENIRRKERKISSREIKRYGVGDN